MDRLRVYLNSLKEYARDYVLENTGLKILALLITAVLWLSVASRPVSQVTLYNVPIEFRNLPQSPQLTVSGYDSETARVYLTGPRDVLDTLRASDLTVFADMSNVEPGVRVIPLQLDSSRIPASVKENGVEPRSIRATVERVVEKEVPVVPRFEGAPPENYDVLGREVYPPSVRIVGAESFVREIEQVSTESVSLSDETATFTKRVAIDIGSQNVALADRERREVVLTVMVGEKQKERVFERLPVVGLPDGAPPRYVTVKVAGAQSAVDAMGMDDITVTVEAASNPSRPLEGATKATISPAYADRVRVVSVEPGKIRIR